MTTYPTISISLNEERLTRLSELVRRLREDEEMISRSEVVGRAIDLFFLTTCSSESPVVPCNDRA